MGGINVFAAQVAAGLRENPAVLDASLQLMRADEGNRPKAFIVPRAGEHRLSPTAGTTGDLGTRSLQ